MDDNVKSSTSSPTHVTKMIDSVSFLYRFYIQNPVEWRMVVEIHSILVN